jgi:hypothetical protein
MVEEVEGYLWMRRRSADATREEAATAVGRAMRRKLVCAVIIVLWLPTHPYLIK